MTRNSVTSAQPLPGAAPGGALAGVGDFNGDGKTDLLWVNSANPQQY